MQPQVGLLTQRTSLLPGFNRFKANLSTGCLLQDRAGMRPRRDATAPIAIGSASPAVLPLRDAALSRWDALHFTPLQPEAVPQP